MGRRFLLPIEQPCSKAETYKERFIVQSQKDKEKEFNIHTSKIVRHEK